MITNLSGSTANIAGINVADGKSITASTWDESVDVSREHKGLWLNLDSKLNSNGINLQNVSIQLPLRQIDLNTVNSMKKITINGAILTTVLLSLQKFGIQLLVAAVKLTLEPSIHQPV